MRQSFREYRECRELIDFNINFSQLCEAIIKSGMSFEEYWQNHALPVLLRSESTETEDQLLVEFWSSLKGMFGGNQYDPVADMRAKQNAQAQRYFQQMTPGNQISPEKQEKLAQFQKKTDQQIKNIKQRFQIAMRDFLKVVTDDAKTQNDPHMWQIAQSFYKKLMASVQPVIDQFTLKAKFGKAGYMDQFKQQADAMQQSRQANMKQSLLQKFGAPHDAAFFKIFFDF